ncbi:MAG: TVP38/TMEM64 family protein [Chloroflexi bacterium]|nr:TVP38/TMEM64 family protein [Chloroflexota bacterium]
MEEQSKQKWINRGIVAFIFLSILGATLYYFSQCDEGVCLSLAEFVEGFGPWAPLAFAALYIVSAPIPFLAPLFSAMAGVLFGTLLGTVYTIIIAAVSALVPFILARRLGREWVESKLKGQKLEKAYRQSSGSQGFWFVVLMRAVPLLPWEVQNYVAGLTKVSIPLFLFATMVGIIPGSFSLVFLGASVADPTPLQLTIAIALKVATALVPVVAIYVRSRRGKKEEKTLEEKLVQCLYCGFANPADSTTCYSCEKLLEEAAKEFVL